VVAAGARATEDGRERRGDCARDVKARGRWRGREARNSAGRRTDVTKIEEALERGVEMVRTPITQK